MSDKDKPRIVALQKQVATARRALLRIREYGRNPEAIACSALEEMDALEHASRPYHADIHETRFKGVRA